MDGISKLEAIEALKMLKARYFYHLDKKEWAEWGRVFTDDVVMDVSGEFPDAEDPSMFIMKGRDTIVKMVSASLEGVVSVHHGHMPIFSFESEILAKGIWVLEDNLFRADGHRMTGYGHYHETYRCEDGEWKIAETRVERLTTLQRPTA